MKVEHIAHSSCVTNLQGAVNMRILPSDELLLCMIMQYLEVMSNLLVQLIELVSCINISQGERHTAGFLH